SRGIPCATIHVTSRGPSTPLRSARDDTSLLRRLRGPPYCLMVNICIEYTGDLHCDAVHGPSHAKIATDAPTDNKGKGESFSPTDLVATALGTCISTTMGLKAESLGVDLRGMKVSVQKEMSKDAPRRIVALPSEVHIPLPPTSPHREVLE